MSFKAAVRRIAPRSALWRIASIRLAYAGAGDPRANFGDQLSPVLLARLYGVKTKHSGFGACDMVAVGSLFEAVEQMCTERPLVWGTGYIQDGGPYAGGPVDVRAVRGRLTLERVSRVLDRESVALGDPGLLAAEAYPEFTSVAKKVAVGVIPHFTDHGDSRIREAAALPGVKVIDVLDSPERVIRQIAECTAVMSSSLHGLIIADSFSIPNFWTPLGSGLTGGRYKFDDYLPVFDREAVPHNLLDGIKTVDSLVSRWSPPESLRDVRQKLLNSFLFPAM